MLARCTALTRWIHTQWSHVIISVVTDKLFYIIFRSDADSVISLCDVCISAGFMFPQQPICTGLLILFSVVSTIVETESQYFVKCFLKKKIHSVINFLSFFFFSFFFLGPRPWYTEVPRPGVKSELQLPVYTTDIAMPDS